MSAVSELKLPMLHQPNGPFFRAFEDESSPRVQQSCWQRWKVTVVKVGSLGCAIGSAVLAAMDYHKAINVISSLATGVFVQNAISYGETGASLERIWDVSQMIGGPLLNLGLGFITANYSALLGPMELASCGLIGMNAHIMIHRLIDQGWVIAIDRHADKEVQGEKLQLVRLNPYVLEFLKISIAAGLGAGYFFVQDHGVQGIFAFGSSYLAFGVLGKSFSKWLKRQIIKHDQDGQGTRWLYVDKALLTLSYCGIWASFVRWINNPGDYERLVLFLTGGFLGTFRAIENQPKEDRLETIPLHLQGELSEISPPDQNEHPWGASLYRWLKMGFPVAAAMGMTAFLIDQFATDSKDHPPGIKGEVAQELALGGFLFSFITHGAFCIGVNKKWDPNRRTWLDEAMKRIFICRNIMGIYPLDIVLLTTSIQSISGSAMAAQNIAGKVISVAGWFFLGIEISGATFVAWCGKKGSPTIKYPHVLLPLAMRSLFAYLRS